MNRNDSREFAVIRSDAYLSCTAPVPPHNAQRHLCAAGTCRGAVRRALVLSRYGRSESARLFTLTELRRRCVRAACAMRSRHAFRREPTPKHHAMLGHSLANTPSAGGCGVLHGVGQTGRPGRT